MHGIVEFWMLVWYNSSDHTIKGTVYLKILVLSDSHSSLHFMRLAIDTVKPDVVLHLGDYARDWEAVWEDYPQISSYYVPGNCDRYHVSSDLPEVIMPRIGGVDIFMTHGHRHNVKLFYDGLIADARSRGAMAALFGHTHEAYCEQEEDGMWVMNPGSCGFYGGSVGFMEIENGRILHCRILRQSDLEVIQ